MADPDDIVPIDLRRPNGTFDRLSDDGVDPKTNAANGRGGMVVVDRRLDRIETCVEGIVRRLDPVDAH